MDEPFAVDVNNLSPKKMLGYLGSLTAFKKNYQKINNTEKEIVFKKSEDARLSFQHSQDKKHEQENNRLSIKSIAPVFLLLPAAIVEIIIGHFHNSMILTTLGLMLVIASAFFLTKQIGVSMTNRPADRQFHFGYHKIEGFAILIISVTMMIITGIMSYSIFQGFFADNKTIFTIPILVGLTIGSIAIYLAIQVMYLKNNKNSGILPRIGREGMIFSLGPIISSIFLSITSVSAYPNYDEIGALLIVGLTLFILVKHIKNSFFSLLDSCYDTSLPQRIQTAIENKIKNSTLLESQLSSLGKDTNNYLQSVKIKQVLVRYMSNKIYAEIHIEMDENMPLAYADIIMNHIEQITYSEFSDIKKITVVPHSNIIECNQLSLNNIEKIPLKVRAQ